MFFVLCFTLFAKKIYKPPRIHEALVWIGHPRSRPVPSMMVDDGWWGKQPVFVDPPHLGFFGPWGSFWWWLLFVVVVVVVGVGVGVGVVVVVVVVLLLLLLLLLLLFFGWCGVFCVAFVVWLMGCFALGNSKNPYRKFQDEIANCFETKFLVDYLWFFASGIFVGG